MDVEPLGVYAQGRRCVTTFIWASVCVRGAIVEGASKPSDGTETTGNLRSKVDRPPKATGKNETASPRGWYFPPRPSAASSEHGAQPPIRSLSDDPPRPSKNTATPRKTSPPKQTATPKGAISSQASGGFAELQSWQRVPQDESVFGGTGEQIMWSVAAGGSALVAVGHDSSSGTAAVWASRDGWTWQRVVHDEAVFGGRGGQIMTSVATWNYGLVAVGCDQGRAAVWTTADGNLWQRVAHHRQAFGGAGKHIMWSVARGGPGLVAVGDDEGRQAAAVWISSDGESWQRVAHDERIFGGDGRQEMSSVAAWRQGLVAVGCDRGRAAVWLSADGKAWQRIRRDEDVFGEIGDQGMQSVASSGWGLVAVGHDRDRAAVWTSADGNQWERVSHDEWVFGGPGEQRMESVAAVGPRLVAVGNDAAGAAVWVSMDGRNWQRVARDDSVFDGDGEQGIWSVTVWGQEVVAVGTDRGRPAVWICGAAVTSGQQHARRSANHQSRGEPPKQTTPHSGTVASKTAVPPIKTAVAPRGGPIRASGEANRNQQRNNPNGGRKALRQTPKQAGRFEFVDAILLLVAIGLVVLYFALRWV